MERYRPHPKKISNFRLYGQPSPELCFRISERNYGQIRPSLENWLIISLVGILITLDFLINYLSHFIIGAQKVRSDFIFGFINIIALRNSNWAAEAS